MRPRGRILVPFAFSSAALAAAVAAAGGCVDLFHGTDFSTACDLDALACQADGSFDGNDAPSGDGGLYGDGGGATDGPADFCAWTYEESHYRARHACAWLGACAGAFLDNAFGSCLDRAILAYDCGANPNRRVIGKAHAFWDCLWRADTCAAVQTCVYGGASPVCPASASERQLCSGSNVLDCAKNSAVAPPIGAVNCEMAGQTCGGSSGVCAGGSTCAEAGTSCDTPTRLRDCTDTPTLADLGQDCAYYGAGACDDVDGGTPACRPNANIDAGADAACVPSPSLTCEDLSTAVGCATGVRETVDCHRLMEDAGSCNQSEPGRPWEVARACRASSEQCTGDVCLDSGVLRACHRRQIVDIECGAYGLKPCNPQAVPQHVLVAAPACSP